MERNAVAETALKGCNLVYAAVRELQNRCVKKQENCISFLSVSFIATPAGEMLLRHPRMISNDRSVSVIGTAAALVSAYLHVKAEWLML